MFSFDASMINFMFRLYCCVRECIESGAWMWNHWWIIL